MTKAAAPENSELLFHWERPGKALFVLLGFILLSLAAHAATFFLFTVVYPQHVTLPPPAPQVTLLTSATPEGQAMLRWLEAEDPALGSSAGFVSPANLLEVPYRPSFLKPRTAPQKPAESTSAETFPPAKPPLAIIRRDARFAKAEVVPQSMRPSSVRFSGILRRRALVQEPALEMKRKSDVPLRSAEFLVGVNADGAVAFVFLQKESGVASVDQHAAALLSKFSFAPEPGPTRWGFATFAWGDDAYQSPPPTDAEDLPR